jgi:CHASE2 domain-containing sensor protein
MMVASGLASLVAWFIVEPKLALLILTGLVLVTAVLSIVLSYVFWRADPDRTANGTH